MTEMANWMVIGMPNNYSSLGGYAFQSLTIRGATRGQASTMGGRCCDRQLVIRQRTALSLWAANVGTETTVSIIGPASAAMLVAIKADGRPGEPPRHRAGLCSTRTPPVWMTRSVADAAIPLNVLEGARSVGPDDHRLRAPRWQRLHLPRRRCAEGRGSGVPRAWIRRCGHAARRIEAKRRHPGRPEGDAPARRSPRYAMPRCNRGRPADPPSVLAEGPGAGTRSRCVLLQISGRKWDGTRTARWC